MFVVTTPKQHERNNPVQDQPRQILMATTELTWPQRWRFQIRDPRSRSMRPSIPASAALGPGTWNKCPLAYRGWSGSIFQPRRSPISFYWTEFLIDGSCLSGPNSVAAVHTISTCTACSMPSSTEYLTCTEYSVHSSASESSQIHQDPITTNIHPPRTHVYHVPAGARHTERISYRTDMTSYTIILQI